MTVFAVNTPWGLAVTELLGSQPVGRVASRQAVQQWGPARAFSCELDAPLKGSLPHRCHCRFSLTDEILEGWKRLKGSSSVQGLPDGKTCFFSLIVGVALTIVGL